MCGLSLSSLHLRLNDRPRLGKPLSLRQSLTHREKEQQMGDALAEYTDHSSPRPRRPAFYRRVSRRPSVWALVRGLVLAAVSAIDPSRRLAAARAVGSSPRPLGQLPLPAVRRSGKLGRFRRGVGLLFVLPAHTQNPHRRYRNRQPEPLHSLGIGHLRLLPLPTAAFDQLEALFDPVPQTVPARLGRLRRQVGDQEPGLLVARLPAPSNVQESRRLGVLANATP